MNCVRIFSLLLAHERQKIDSQLIPRNKVLFMCDVLTFTYFLNWTIPAKANVPRVREVGAIGGFFDYQCEILDRSLPVVCGCKNVVNPESVDIIVHAFTAIGAKFSVGAKRLIVGK